MAEINKPNGFDIRSKQLEEIQEIIQYLSEPCDSDITPYQKSKIVLAKLKELLPLFEDEDGMEAIRISVYGFIHRLGAIEKGYFNHSSDNKKEAGTPIEDEVIYALPREIGGILRNVDEILNRSTISMDAHRITDTLSNPEKFNSAGTQKILLRYPKRIRAKIRELGINAFITRSRVNEGAVQNTLGGN